MAATILNAGGEDIDFTVNGSVSVNTTNTNYDSSFARCALSIAGAAADPPTNRLTFDAFASAQSSFWVHGRFALNSQTTTSGSQPIRLLDGSTCRLIVRGTGTNGTLKISTRNGAGTITDLVTCSAATWNLTVNTFDLFVNYAVSGTVTLYINGTQVGTYSGDITTNSATTLSQVEFSGINTGSGVNGTMWSECIVSTSDTRGKRLYGMHPAAAGNTQSWTPSTVGNINETTLSDATLVSTSTNNALSQWTTPTSLPTGSWTVDAIVQSARVEVGVSGPQHFDWSVRTIDGGAADNLAGASVAPSTSFGNFHKIWAQNPHSSADWATTDIGSGFNLGIKALA